VAGASSPALSWGAGCLLPAQSRLGGALALCFAVVAAVDMETLQLSARGVPGGGGAPSLWGGGEAGAGGWEHKSRAVVSSRHGGSRGQGQQNHQFPVPGTRMASPTNRVPTGVTQELGIRLAPSAWAP